ncbi:DNA polymerase-1 [Devosia enhydra]|uniref:DNA-directed DNA polymerase n=1 Tax=Devosia enhydra TaxID=665118 RepID=A0A1K2HTS0_9HYPH|nr:DNA polymerase [Devosia enhydra]SFZ81692.1 DNA polymerase-1 [Devosia enhydra]
MLTLIADAETNGFLRQMTCVHMLQIGTEDGDDVDVYADQPGYPPIQEGLDRLSAADRVVFHNGAKFDFHAINKVYPGTLRPEQIWDTLLAARLLFNEEKEHSLKAWGKRLGIEKLDYEGGFETFNEDMVVYGAQDIRVGRALYHYLLKKMEGWEWDQSLQIENLFAIVIGLQEQNGFPLNVAKVAAKVGDLKQEQHDLTQQLQAAFPPIIHERYSPKTGKRLKDKIEVFNPGSGQQVARRLTERYGWKPTKFTDSGIPATDEQVMAGLKYPEARLLLRYARIAKMLGQMSDGKNAWLKLVDAETGRIHGAVNTLGTGTGRCTHFKPNVAQADKELREPWEPRKGWVQVGCDAEGLEFRMLAHYMARLDGGRTTDTVLNGNKSKGTDIHSLNQRAGSLYLRDSAKTAIYALIYGAADPTLGKTVFDDARAAGKPRPVGNQKLHGARLREALGKGTPGLTKLIEQVVKTAKKQGYVKGIDGRKIKVRSSHSAFNFLLQGGGAIAMKVALNIFHFERVPARGWVHARDFAYLANVHDEVQVECVPELAKAIGAELADCIREAGERLGIRCPLAGSFDIGANWHETH